PPGTRFRYAGPVLSGATLGAWEHAPLDAGDWARLVRWRCRRWTVDLPYRDELGTIEQTEQERERWQAEGAGARRGGGGGPGGDGRAMAERMTRRLTRLRSLPPGRTFPLPVALWQVGDGLWLAVEGEHYQQFQTALRGRFPGVPLVVLTLANGSRPAYLPPRDPYGKGIYQESIALLAPRCLEALTEAVAAGIPS